MLQPDELAEQVDNLRTLAQIIATLLIVVAVESHRIIIKTGRGFVPILLAISAVALAIDTFTLANVETHGDDPTYIGTCLTMSSFVIALLAISIPLLLIKAPKPDTTSIDNEK
jgi:hypothetical protein